MKLLNIAIVTEIIYFPLTCVFFGYPIKIRGHLTYFSFDQAFSASTACLKDSPIVLQKSFSPRLGRAVHVF